MAYTATQATIVGGIEGNPGPATVNTAPLTSTVNGVLAGATALTGFVNVVSAAASLDSYALPPMLPMGAPLVVTNVSATAAKVFPAATGQINGGTAGASVSVAANKSAVFYYIGVNTSGAPQWAAAGV